MTRTEFLREQTVTGANKIKRAPIPSVSVTDMPVSIAERKAEALAWIFGNMPIYIGQGELIVGTRTFFGAKAGNEDGHDRFAYSLKTAIPYLTEDEIELFGFDGSYRNKTHFTPDFSIILKKGIDRIIFEAEEEKKKFPDGSHQGDFLSAVAIAYRGLKALILRYSDEALALAEGGEGDRAELMEISRVCRKISGDAPESFREAVQLLWFTHLGTIIESFEFVNYGRLDVILGEFLGDTPYEEAQQLIECLLLKMYDQADVATSYLGKYAAQLVVTLGGVLKNGENAVNDVTFMFLDAAGKIRLPEPEFNLRVSVKNPPEFLDRAARLTVEGCNFISYYNDELFVKSLCGAGIPTPDARDYGFDLCQDINIPGRDDTWVCGSLGLVTTLMEMLKERRDFADFEALVEEYKACIGRKIGRLVESYNLSEQMRNLYAEGRFNEYFDRIKREPRLAERCGNTPMAPLPLLSALYHGSIENGLDVAFEPYPLKDKGIFFGTAVEAVNSLAALKKRVYEEKSLTLDQVVEACLSDFSGKDGERIRALLWSVEKWGNDSSFVDDIAKEIFEYSLGECKKYKTFFGGQILGGLHQPHPVPTGAKLMATPEGRHAGAPVAVSLTPESATMKKGATAALASAARIDPSFVQWNYCVMINYFSSVFRGNEGSEVFKRLLLGYFALGGLQHQPNVLDVDTLRRAQAEPEKYKDVIVRLWGVSAHFVDLPRELQDEMIARFS